MKCVYCEKADTKVIETRENKTELRRRRECLGCQQRFTTYERVEARPIKVIKKDKAKTLFDRDKLVKGMTLSCEKRPVTEAQIQEAVNDIEQTIRKSGKLEVPSKQLGDMVMDRLKKLDKVAYLRFASVYKQFRSLRGFEKEIEVLTGGN